ncbi:MAG: hypothetical protein ACD_56C00007G0001 [uncultured bacterium]|nr:MAG: hypothetical protein ACD_56C00007G0001 [uncultured bacterium]
MIAKSSASTKIGTVTDSFDWVVSGSVVALVFSEKDVRGMISASSKSGVDDSQVKTEIVKVDYGSVEPDFELSSLNLRVYAELESTPIIDSEKIKKDLLGKNDDKLADILRKYPSIKSADVEFSPSFISKIPNYPSRVNIEIQNEAN